MREMRLDPIDVIGFSAGGFIAAEMVAADPKIFSRMILVAPMGIKPAQAKSWISFRSLSGRHLRATVADPAETPEFTKLYGGEMTPEQFEAVRGRARRKRADRMGAIHAQSQPAVSAARRENSDDAGVGDARQRGAARDVSTATRRRSRARRLRRSRAWGIGRRSRTRSSSNV